MQTLENKFFRTDYFTLSECLPGIWKQHNFKIIHICPIFVWHDDLEKMTERITILCPF